MRASGINWSNFAHTHAAKLVVAMIIRADIVVGAAGIRCHDDVR